MDTNTSILDLTAQIALSREPLVTSDQGGPMILGSQKQLVKFQGENGQTLFWEAQRLDIRKMIGVGSIKNLCLVIRSTV